MEKLELLTRIQNLSAIVHSTDLAYYNLSAAVLEEMKHTLDEMTEQYIAAYC